MVAVLLKTVVEQSKACVHSCGWMFLDFTKIHIHSLNHAIVMQQISFFQQRKYYTELINHFNGSCGGKNWLHKLLYKVRLHTPGWMAFPMVHFPVVHHTWVLVSRGSSGYTRNAISQGKTNVTRMKSAKKLCFYVLLSNGAPWLALLPRASKHPSSLPR